MASFALRGRLAINKKSKPPVNLQVTVNVPVAEDVVDAPVAPVVEYQSFKKVFIGEQRTPYKEEGSCASALMVLAWTTAALLLFFVVWTMMKLPYLGNEVFTNKTINATYCNLNDDPRCLGPEGQANMKAWNGYRSFKLTADNQLFVAPHASMGIVIECLFAVLLLRGYAHVDWVSKIIVPLSALFALHIAPASGGVPGAAVNFMLVVLIWVFCGTIRWSQGWLRMQQYARTDG